MHKILRRYRRKLMAFLVANFRYIFDYMDYKLVCINITIGD